jgi:hypothetical protein
MKYIRNPRLESEVKARRSGEGRRAARVSEFNSLDASMALMSTGIVAESELVSSWRRHASADISLIAHPV